MQAVDLAKSNSMNPILEEQAHPSASRNLYEAGDALRQHLLGHLCFPNLLALSKASSQWHELILATPMHKLGGNAVRMLLPSGVTSRQSLRRELQERANFLARLRGKSLPGRQGADAPDNAPAEIQRLTFQGGPVENILWSLQADSSQPSQHICIYTVDRGISAAADLPDNDKHEFVLTLLDVPTGQPVNLHATECYSLALATQARAQAAPARPSLQSFTSAMQPGPVRCKKDLGYSASWTADGRHLVVTSNPPYRCLPILPSPSGPPASPMMLANISARSVAAVGNQLARQLVVATEISPKKNMVLWVQESAQRRQNGKPALDDQFAVRLLPSLELQYIVEPPPFLKRRPHSQWRMHDVQWAPDSSKFLIRWVRFQSWAGAPGDDEVSMYCSSELGGLSIHSADDGACLMLTLCGELKQKMERDQGIKCNEVGSAVSWAPCSSYLIWRSSGVGVINMAGRMVWHSSIQQRGYDSLFRSFVGEVDHWISTDARAAATGPFVAVAEVGINTGGWQLSCSLVSILDASDGHTLFQWSPMEGSGLRGFGNFQWAADSSVYLSPVHGIVIMPITLAKGDTCPAIHPPADHMQCAEGISPSSRLHGSMVVGAESLEPAWCRVMLHSSKMDQQSQPYTSYLRMSPCGKVVAVVLQVQQGDTCGYSQACNRKWQLQHWHMSDVAWDDGNTSPAGGNGRCWVEARLCPALLPHKPDMDQLAWHPQYNMCMYACYDCQKGVHLVDARSDCIVKSWTADELAGQSCEPCVGACRGGWRGSDRRLGNGLEWSHDGCKLAISLDQPCVVLDFKGKRRDL